MTNEMMTFRSMLEKGTYADVLFCNTCGPVSNLGSGAHEGSAGPDAGEPERKILLTFHSLEGGAWTNVTGDPRGRYPSPGQ
jgi:hypothetical protein